ncbi:hypothetical protein V12G01_02500 [Vibrio alginolyticus 12G01]|nr:hypothetical protein V12G01_02500 [Vibrio alginolyticus 12G01]
MASAGIRYQAEWTEDPKRIKVLSKTIVPPIKPTHLLLFMLQSQGLPR